MNKAIDTKQAPPPFSHYAQGMEVPAGARVVHVSGQVGMEPGGKLPVDAREQHKLAWSNVLAVLKGSNMTNKDIVDVLAIVTDHDQVPVYREVRDSMLGGHACASTLLVSGLANPAWKVEIAVTAAKKG